MHVLDSPHNLPSCSPHPHRRHPRHRWAIHIPRHLAHTPLKHFYDLELHSKGSLTEPNSFQSVTAAKLCAFLKSKPSKIYFQVDVSEPALSGEATGTGRGIATPPSTWSSGAGAMSLISTGFPNSCNFFCEYHLWYHPPPTKLPRSQIDQAL